MRRGRFNQWDRSMSRAMNRMTEKAWRIGEWLTVFGAMVWALGWPPRR